MHATTALITLKKNTSYSNTNIAFALTLFSTVGIPRAKAGEVLSSLKGKHPRAFLGFTISIQHYYVCWGYIM